MMLRKSKFLVLVLSLLLVLAACGKDDDSDSASKDDSKSDSKPQELVVVDFGGSVSEAAKKAIYEPFEKEYNAKVTVVSPSDRGKLEAMVQSGNVTWDVFMEDSFYAQYAGEKGILEKIDYSIVNPDGIYPHLVNDYSVGFQIIYHNIAYNTEVFPDGNHPKTWAEVFDTKKFPGKRALWGTSDATIEIALLADGVKPEELYPLDIDRALKKLDEIKKDVSVWIESPSQAPQLLDSKEVIVAQAFNARVDMAKQEGLPVENEYNQAVEWYNAWMVPKGAPNKELAMKFIHFASQPEIQANYAALVSYAPANEKAIDLLPEEKKELYKSIADKTVKSDIEYLANNFGELNDRFNEWLLK